MRVGGHPAVVAQWHKPGVSWVFDSIHSCELDV